MFLNSLGKWIALALIFFIPLSTAMTSVCLGLVVFSQILQKSWWRISADLLKHPLVQVGCLLFLLHLFGLVYSQASWQDQQAVLRDALKFLLPLFLVPYFSQERDQKRALFAFMAAMGIMFVAACLKYYGGIPIGSEQFSRAAVFKNHIISGFLMSFAAFVLAHVLVHKPAWRKVGVISLALLIFYVVFMNIGRTGWVLLAILAALFGWQYGRWRGLFMAALLLGTVMGVAYKTTEFSKRVEAVIQTAAGESDESSILRRQYVENSLHLVSKRPLFGAGTGTFPMLYAAYAKERGFATTVNPHNQYLMFAVQFGGIGLFLFLMCLLKLRSAIVDLPPFAADIATGLLVALVVGCVINSWLQDFTEGYFFMAAFSVLFGTYQGLRYDNH